MWIVTLYRNQQVEKVVSVKYLGPILIQPIDYGIRGFFGWIYYLTDINLLLNTATAVYQRLERCCPLEQTYRNPKRLPL